MNWSTVFRALCVFTAAATVSAFGVSAAKAVTGQNDAPVLDATRTPVLASESDATAFPAGAVGTPISWLVDYVTPAGGLDNVSDADIGEGDPVVPIGAAIVGTDTTNGTWYFSIDGGASWSAVGSVSSASALLLSGNTARLYFHSDGFSGTIPAAITFRAWDGTSGSSGSVASTAVNGGTSAFSIATDTAALSVVGAPDLSVTDVGAPNPVTVGGQVTYTLTVNETGPDATGVQLDDDWARSLRFVSLSSSQGVCKVKTKLRHVVCALGTVTGSSPVTVTVVFRTTKIGSIDNTASASATNVTPDSGDTATETVLVTR